MIRNFIFLGAPGVGKGTLAAEVANLKGIKHISTGEIFRNEIKNQTALGKQVESLLAAGHYVPDEITNEIVRGVLQREDVKKSGVILDGYPRTSNQAEFLKQIGFDLTGAVLLTATDDDLVKRLLGRGRADDKPEIIRERIQVYNTQTKPLIDYYRAEGKIIEVPAHGTIEENLKNLLEALY